MKAYKLTTVALGLSLLFGFSSQASTQTCKPSDLQNLYKATVETICSVNQIWKLTGFMSEKTAKDSENRNYQIVCGATYWAMTTTSAIVSASDFKKTMPAEYLDESKKSLDYKKIYEMMRKNPKNFTLLQQVSSFYGDSLTKGQSQRVYKAAQYRGRAATVLVGVSAAGAIAIVGELLSATTAACSESIDAYLYRQASTNCKVDKRLSPQVMSFMNLSEEEQEKVLTQHPRLCQAYVEITKNMEKKMAAQVARAEEVHCADTGVTAKLHLGDKGVSEVHLVDDKATMVLDSETYNVEYGKDANNQRVLKSITVQNKVNQSGVYGAPYRYTFPPKDHQVDSSRFRKAFAEVGRQTRALENSGAFERCQPGVE